MRYLLALIVLVTASLAADISGTWKGQFESPNGNMERTFVFKVDGSKVTGETTSSMMGKSEIRDGKIEGDDLSFTITVDYEGNQMTLKYKGKVKGNEIHFNVEAQEVGQVAEYTAKRVS